jgi:hypothetical protein
MPREQPRDLGFQPLPPHGRGGSMPSFHLQNQDRDTPSARHDTACGTLRASL